MFSVRICNVLMKISGKNIIFTWSNNLIYETIIKFLSLLYNHQLHSAKLGYKMK